MVVLPVSVSLLRFLYWYANIPFVYAVLLDSRSTVQCGVAFSFLMYRLDELIIASVDHFLNRIANITYITYIFFSDKELYFSELLEECQRRLHAMRCTSAAIILLQGSDLYI